MPRRLVPDPSVGERLRARRELRGWSVRHAASRAGVAHTTWSRIEHGTLRTDRYMIADLAAALECSISDLTGQPFPAADRRLESAHIHAEALWIAMMAHPFAEPPGAATAPSYEALEREVALLRDLYGACDYAGVLGRLVAFVPALHSATAGPDRGPALRMAVAVYGCAMGSLINVGRVAQGWLAAERCTEAAQELDDPVALGVAAANRARVAACSGAFVVARSICDRADAGIELDLAAPDALAVTGFLHLARAHHAAGLHDLDAAAEHLAEATAIADRTGETDSWDLAWGPRNVALWRMALELDTGRVGEAIETAATVPMDGLPAVRQVYYYLDLARGLADVGRADDAVRTLLAAERTGPQHTRSSVAARETARSLLRLQRATSPLAGLAERMGIAV